MSTYVFEVYVDEMDDVYRYIQVKGDETFMAIHKMIVSSFGIKGEKAAVFFESNPRFLKVREIFLDEEPSMENALDGMETKLSASLDNDIRHFVYYNENRPRLNFLIQVESQAKEDGKYPSVIEESGQVNAAGKVEESFLEQLDVYSDEEDLTGFGVEEMD